jgi:putative transposase
MILEANTLYHIYNQGNNKQKIFCSHENYIYFLKKIKLYIIPHADILAWCLMPNHFHLMVFIHSPEISVSDQPETTINAGNIRNMNDSVGLILRTYTRAFNKQKKSSGSLFKTHTQAEAITGIKGNKPPYYITSREEELDKLIPEVEYPQICFNYIHDNPVKAKLAQLPEGWEFSSYRDYCGLRNGTLVNKERASSFGLRLPD